jgi:hypothetical protein
MKNQNIVSVLISLALIASVGLACKNLTKLNSDGNTSKPESNPPISNVASNTSPDNSAGQKIDNPGLEKPDFTVTSEQLDKEFTRDGVTEKDLAKYANKNIAVSGRVSMIVLEKKGTVQPWVTIYAPGVLHGVNCYFDDKNVDQLKMLKEDNMAKVQGFQDDFIVPKISPHLSHCAVLETK